MSQRLEGILFAIAFVLIVGGIGWYGRWRYRDMDALAKKAKAEAKQSDNPEISQPFAKQVDGD